MQKTDNDDNNETTDDTSFGVIAQDLSDAYTVTGDCIVNSGLSYTGSEWVTITSSEYESPQAKLEKRLDAIEDRLAILNPNEDLMEKYPALREAYEHYKTVEALVNGEKDDGSTTD